MKIAQRQKDQVDYFEISGDLDFNSSPELKEKLQQAFAKQAKSIVINLKKVGYIDSSGLATFVDALKKTKAVSGKLILTDLSDAVRSVFEIAKLDQIFTLVESETEAVRLFTP